MLGSADTNYSFNPWMDFTPRPGDNVDPISPNLSAEGILAEMVVPSAVARTIRPPVGNVLFPPREGYERRPLDIMDALTIGQQTLIRAQELGQQGTLGPSMSAR